MWFWKVCLIQVTTYSVSDSVNWIGFVDDLNNGPKAAISGTEANCSAENKNRIIKYKNEKDFCTDICGTKIQR